MKHLLLIVAAINSLSAMSFNEDNRKLQPMEYVVVSDNLDSEIDQNKFKISGVVKMFSSANPLEEVLVGCTSSGSWVRTDSDGKFELSLPATDSIVYFYKKGWSEVVMEDYDFKAGHHVVLDVYLVQNNSGNQLKRKPVIYMYSEKDLSATVKLDPYGEFVYTYPEYQKEWKVTVKSEGGLEVDDKSYPYLFWEAKSAEVSVNKIENEIPGFVIESKDVTAFFEEKLDALGFNQTEKTDFITYWGPILSKKDYAFVQFVVGDDYQNNIASIDITPIPDAMKRVFILCSPIDQADIGYKLVPQELKSFERKGFTVVEWGGSIVDLNLLKYEIGL
jgi:hypothetical protein